MAQIYSPGSAGTVESCSGSTSSVDLTACYENGLTAGSSEWFSGLVTYVDVAALSDDLAMVAYYDSTADRVKAVGINISAAGGLSVTNEITIADNYQTYPSCAVFKLSSTKAIICYYPDHQRIDLIAVELVAGTLQTQGSPITLTTSTGYCTAYQKAENSVVFFYGTLQTTHIVTVGYDGSTLVESRRQTFSNTSGGSSQIAVYPLSTDLVLLLIDGYDGSSSRFDFQVIQFLPGDTGKVSLFSLSNDPRRPFITRISATRYICGARQAGSDEASIVLIDIVDRPLNQDGSVKTPAYEPVVLSTISTLNSGESYDFASDSIQFLTAKPAVGRPDIGKSILFEHLDDNSGVAFYGLTTTGDTLTYTGPTLITSQQLHGAVDLLDSTTAILAGVNASNALTALRIPL